MLMTLTVSVNQCISAPCLNCAFMTSLVEPGQEMLWLVQFRKAAQNALLPQSGPEHFHPPSGFQLFMVETEIGENLKHPSKNPQVWNGRDFSHPYLLHNILYLKLPQIEHGASCVQCMCFTIQFWSLQYNKVTPCLVQVLSHFRLILNEA